MTIEEIKEWRKSPTCSCQAYLNIDILLEEVERLKDGYAMVVDNLAYAQKCQERAESNLTNRH